MTNNDDSLSLALRANSLLSQSQHLLFLYASEWGFEELNLTGSGVLKKASMRHERNFLGEFIYQARPLWITAAGQQESGGTNDAEGENLHARYPKGPMNLGDLPNVIIVTACENCWRRRTDIRLMDSANTSSDGFVTSRRRARRYPDQLPQMELMQSRSSAARRRPRRLWRASRQRRRRAATRSTLKPVDVEAMAQINIWPGLRAEDQSKNSGRRTRSESRYSRSPQDMGATNRTKSYEAVDVEGWCGTSSTCCIDGLELSRSG